MAERVGPQPGLRMGRQAAGRHAGIRRSGNDRSRRGDRPRGRRGRHSTRVRHPCNGNRRCDRGQAEHGRQRGRTPASDEPRADRRAHHRGKGSGGRAGERGFNRRADQTRGDLGPRHRGRPRSATGQSGCHRERQPAADQPLAQHLAAAREPAPDGSDRPVQSPRGLVVRSALEVAQDQRSPVSGRQPGDLGVQGRGQVGALDLDDHGWSAPRLGERHSLFASPPPDRPLARLQRGAMGHPVQPRAQRAAVAQPQRVRPPHQTRNVAWKASSAA